MVSFFKKQIIDESFNEQLKEFKEYLSKTSSNIEIQEDCDYLQNSFGEFGHTHTNPIPVNGVLGEFKYLHRLRCKCKEALYFHRIGNRKVDWINGGVDIYEAVCYKGYHCGMCYIFICIIQECLSKYQKIMHFQSFILNFKEFLL